MMMQPISQLISQSQANIPRQILRQQPVYLEDARGVLAPFHLEFVTSAEVSDSAPMALCPVIEPTDKPCLDLNLRTQGSL